MAERMSDEYELYLFHLLLGIACEEAEDLLKFGVPPTGVGRVPPLNKELREKVLPQFLEMHGVVRNACVKMIEKNVSGVDDRNDTTEWLKTIVQTLRMRSSLLMEAYGDEMEKVRKLLDNTDRLLDESRNASERAPAGPSAEGIGH